MNLTTIENRRKSTNALLKALGFERADTRNVQDQHTTSRVTRASALALKDSWKQGASVAGYTLVSVGETELYGRMTVVAYKVFVGTEHIGYLELNYSPVRNKMSDDNRVSVRLSTIAHVEQMREIVISDSKRELAWAKQEKKLGVKFGDGWMINKKGKVPIADYIKYFDQVIANVTAGGYPEFYNF
jgi:hypothetical protein